MRIVLDLSDNDLRYFRKRLQEAKKSKLASNETLVIQAARRLMKEVSAAKAPKFVQERFEKLELLVRMLEDERWRLTEPERSRVRTVLTYFVDPDDLIPDSIPGLGYLDDAILLGLVVEEFKNEIEAYEKFCAFEGNPKRTEEKRRTLQSKMRDKVKSERDRRRLVKRGKKGPLGLW